MGGRPVLAVYKDDRGVEPGTLPRATPASGQNPGHRIEIQRPRPLDDPASILLGVLPSLHVNRALVYH